MKLANSHKDPGSEVWVYDIAHRTRVQRIVLKTPAMAIEASQDVAPLLYAGNPVTRTVDVYSLSDGKLQKTIAQTGITTLLQSF